MDESQPWLPKWLPAILVLIPAFFLKWYLTQPCVVDGSRVTSESFTATKYSQELTCEEEEMSLSRNLILCTFLQEHGLQAQSPPGMTNLLQHYNPHPYGDVPHEMAMRLAFIGDEMEVRWTLPRFAELPWMAMYSLAFTYQTGLRGVLRSFVDGLINLRGNRRFWSFLTLRDRVSPTRGRKLSLLLLLLLLLDWSLHLLQ